jgi:hypothetical protein
MTDLERRLVALERQHRPDPHAADLKRQALVASILAEVDQHSSVMIAEGTLREPTPDEVAGIKRQLDERLAEIMGRRR